MLRTRSAAITVSVLVTVLGSLAVPDYSLGWVALVWKPFVLPLLIALPLAIATFRKPSLLTLGAALALCGLLLVAHITISGLVFWWRAGDALFDQVSIPILFVTLAASVITAGIAFIVTWVVLRPKSLHAG
jgi:hypothetical protein